MDLSLVHELHGSLVKSFQGFRFRFHVEFELGYSPLVVPTALEMGTAFHRGMETIYDPETWTLPRLDLYRRAKDVFTKTCRDQEKSFLQLAGQYQLDVEAATDYESRITLGCGMLKKVVQTMDRKGFKPIAVEQEVLIPIRDPLTNELMRCKCADCWQKCLSQIPDFDGNEWEGLPVLFGVRIDAALQDDEGGFWIVDWKSAAQLLKDQIVLELDGQIGAYSWVLADQLGLDFRGFKYVQIRKSFPHLPQQLKVPRLGRAFSISKQTLTDHKTFLLTVKKYDVEAYEAGLYDEHLEWLRLHGPDFISWFTVFKTPGQLETIGRDLRWAIRDLVQPHATYTNPGHHCRFCPFQEPCLERQSTGEDPIDLLEATFHKPGLYYVLERMRREKVKI